MTNDYTIQLEESKKNGIKNSFLESITRSKLASPLGIALLILGSVANVFVMYKFGYNAGMTFLAGLIGIPLLTACIFNIRFGIAAIIFISYFIFIIKRYSGNLPLGVLMDLMIVLMLFGLFIQQIKVKDWSFAKNNISYIILIWIAYNFLEVANPWAESRLAWVYTVRSFAGTMIMYFLLMYSINSKKYITFLIGLWIALAFIGCLWGFQQEYLGFTDTEFQWATETPERYALLWQAGKFRKFSIFSDPLVFGILMAFTGVMCFVLAAGKFKKPVKIILAVLGSLMLFSMLFSGTRAAYVLIPVALLLYAILTFKKSVLAAAAVMLVAGMVLINIPTSNPNLVRFQSAFSPSDDASFNTRKRNQERIKPYIQTHPIGGGLGSVGEWGKKFSPWSELANFPPDSGYVRIAVELGWIGLLLYCTFLFMVFRQGIKNYFRIKDPTLKTYCLAMLVVLFMLAVANFPQEAIGQYPISLLFFTAIAIIMKCKEFDEKPFAVKEII